MQYKRKVISLSLDESLYKSLEELALENKKTVQDMIRDICFGFIKMRDHGNTKKQNSDSK